MYKRQNLYFGRRGRGLLIINLSYEGQVDSQVIKNIFIKGFGYFITPLWQAIYFQGTTLVIRVILGPESVTIFNTVRSLTRSVNQLYTMINVSVFPEL